MLLRRIAYVGVGLGGKSTSLHSLLWRTRQPLPDPIWRLSTDEHTFRLERRDGREPIDLSLSISNRRGIRGGYDPTSADCDPVIRTEIDRIAAADGLIFVIDSQSAREVSNLEHLEKLRHDLASRGQDLRDKPIVFQANKRDLTEIVSMESIRAKFQTPCCAYVESVAIRSIGTLEAVRTLIELIASRDAAKC